MKKRFTSSVEKVGDKTPYVYVNVDGESVYATLNLPSSQVKAIGDREIGSAIWGAMKKQGKDPKQWYNDREGLEKEIEESLKGKFEKAMLAVHNFAQGEVVQAAQRLAEFDRNYLAQLKGESVQASAKLAGNPREELAYASVYPGHINVTLNLPSNNVCAGSLSELDRKIRSWGTEAGLSSEQISKLYEQFEIEIAGSKDKLESEINDKIGRALKAVYEYAQGLVTQYGSQMERQAEEIVRGTKIEPTAAIHRVAYDQSELDFSLTGNLYVRIRFPGGGNINIPWGESGLFKDFIDLTTEMENTERGKAMDAMQKYMNELGKEKSAAYSEKLRSASNSLFEYARGLGNKLMSEMKSAFGQKVKELKGQ